MIFVDTGAWFACFVREDSHHQTAGDWYAACTERLLTTDLVAVELFTLLKARGKLDVALKVGADLLSGGLAEVERTTSDDLNRAWGVFSEFRDKAWSFTDCVSRVVMQRLGITKAFAFDDHFRQFGTVSVLP